MTSPNTGKTVSFPAIKECSWTGSDEISSLPREPHDGMGKRQAVSFDYLRDPAAIYRASFAAIDDETDFSTIPEEIRPIAQRVVHASAMPEIAGQLIYHRQIAASAERALIKGAPILCDAKMVASGIIKSALPDQCQIRCFLDHEEVSALAARLGTTRSAAAVELWRPFMEDSIIAIGNAPTALFHLLEGLLQGRFPRPAAIFAFPIGFIGAAEAKAALMACSKDIAGGDELCFMTLPGRFGGSSLAAAAVNAAALACCENKGATV